MGVIILFTILFNIGTWLCHAYLNRTGPFVIGYSQDKYRKLKKNYLFSFLQNVITKGMLPAFCLTVLHRADIAASAGLIRTQLCLHGTSKLQAVPALWSEIFNVKDFPSMPSYYAYPQIVPCAPQRWASLRRQCA